MSLSSSVLLKQQKKRVYFLKLGHKAADYRPHVQYDLQSLQAIICDILLSCLVNH